MNWKTQPVMIQRPFKLNDKNLGKLKITVKDTFHKSAGHTNVTISVKNKHYKKPLAEEKLNIFKNRAIYGSNIEVINIFREKNLRLGELTRLMSVAQMNENKSPHLRIFSKDTAVYFHTKYKFKPDMSEFDTVEKVLTSISHDKEPVLNDFSKAAMKFKDELWTTDSYCDEWLNSVNEMVGAYLNRVVELKLPKEEHKIDAYIHMVLTREDLLKNKDFFNELYKNHCIDYKI